MNLQLHRLVGIVGILGLTGFTSAIGSPADINFAGTWKGQVKVEVAEGRGGGRTVMSSSSVTVPDEAGVPRTITIVPDAAGNGTSRGTASRSIDLVRQPDGRGSPNGSPPKTHTQTFKLTLSIKVDKKGKLSGYFMAGASRQTAQEWSVDGNKLTFTTVGPNGIPQFIYTAVLNDKELHVRQTPANGEVDVREFTMKR